MKIADRVRERIALKLNVQNTCRRIRKMSPPDVAYTEMETRRRIMDVLEENYKRLGKALV